MLGRKKLQTPQRVHLVEEACFPSGVKSAKRSLVRTSLVAKRVHRFRSLFPKRSNVGRGFTFSKRLEKATSPIKKNLLPKTKCSNAEGFSKKSACKKLRRSLFPNPKCSRVRRPSIFSKKPWFSVDLGEAWASFGWIFGGFRLVSFRVGLVLV